MHDPETHFIEQLGLVAEEDGMPRIAGRMLGYLMLHAGTHSLDALAEVLQVSKASVSTNARLLERMGLIVRTSLPGDRRDFYELPDGQWGGFFAVVKRKLERMQGLLGVAAAQVSPAKARRLEEARRFYAFLLEDLDGKICRWRERRRGDSEG
ncbi:MAG TPA: MarR family transcriptional regulator [Longimicrobiales bacterium]|nr:MarR family transcriptional regulator [Longimicrobiales bacterium]